MLAPPRGRCGRISFDGQNLIGEEEAPKEKEGTAIPACMVLLKIKRVHAFEKIQGRKEGKQKKPYRRYAAKDAVGRGVPKDKQRSTARTHRRGKGKIVQKSSLRFFFLAHQP